MPEAPDLYVVRERLERALVGQTVTRAEALRPLVLRCLAVPTERFAEDVAGRAVTRLWRRGKFLGIALSGADGAEDAPRELVVNPMLSGALQHCAPSERIAARTFVTFDLSDGTQLRYLDDDQMGMVYYIAAGQRGQVARLEGQGPDVLDEPLSLAAFTERLRPYRGEIKGVLTRGGAVGGIGNAYADEILFAARIYPFTKRTALSADQVARLHAAVYRVPAEAVEAVRRGMGDATHRKVRGHLQVHGRGNQACPACAAPLTHITSNGHRTDYCRRCQPGSLLAR